MAVFVIIGTFIESATQSHRYASLFTYSNPIFLSLLVGFFLNILLSALRRWPFKKHHIPFLITHLGLLMVISGVMIKTLYGVQGNMTILEGSGSERIFVPGTQVIYIDQFTAEGIKSHEYTLSTGLLGSMYISSNDPVPGLDVSLLEYSPHSESHYETWIKNKHVFIKGIEPLPLNYRVSLPSLDENIVWNLYATENTNPQDIAKKEFIDNAVAVFKKTQSGKTIEKVPLKELLNKEINIDGTKAISKLDFDQSLLTITFPLEEINIFLTGAQALLNQNTYLYLGRYPITLELEVRPTLLVIKDDNHHDHFYIFDPHGRILKNTYNNDHITLLNVYSKGLGGYSVQMDIPEYSYDLTSLNTEQVNLLKQQLKEALGSGILLSPPLNLLSKTALKKGKNVEDVIADFLFEWNNSYGWLLPQNSKIHSVDTIDWTTVDEHTHQGTQVASKFFAELEKDNNTPLNEKLTWAPWNTKHRHIEEHDVEATLTTLTQQIFQVADQIPNSLETTSARKLSAYMRAYNLHFSKVTPDLTQQISTFPIETPLSQKITALPSLTKLEDNKPKIVLKLTNFNGSQIIHLQYDPIANGIKWPALNEYLLRFQPQTLNIPYHIRLRDARQITYPNSTQPLSYESDIIVTDSRNNSSLDTTLKMNKVHETWDGYRFYMSNLSPAEPTEAQRVQLVINLDPVKYYLTYPGAIIMSIGILLLFWLQPYKRK
jgi:hypothetical protein